MKKCVVICQNWPKLSTYQTVRGFFNTLYIVWSNNQTKKYRPKPDINHYQLLPAIASYGQLPPQLNTKFNLRYWTCLTTLHCWKTARTGWAVQSLFMLDLATQQLNGWLARFRWDWKSFSIVLKLNLPSFLCLNHYPGGWLPASDGNEANFSLTGTSVFMLRRSNEAFRTGNVGL